MSQLSSEGISAAAIKRILAFFNQARTWEDITRKVMDKPETGEAQGYAIGETVAQRILSHRNQLRPRFYRSLEQLDEVEGLGQDKLNDLAYTFRRSAADEFVHQMFTNLLGSNWDFNHYSRSYASQEEFEEIVEHPVYFMEEVGDMLREVAEEMFEEKAAAQLAPLLTKGVYVDTYHTTDFAQYAWALWFYQFDSDNWFSFERVREQISAYLGLYFWAAEEIQLRLLRGFDGKTIWPAAHDTLPVTINSTEMTISIWQAQLFD